MARPMPPVSPCAPWLCRGTSTPTGLVRAATTRRGARRSTTSMASSITPTGSTTCSSPPPWEGENYEPRNPMESEALDLRALELPTDATTGIELSALHDALTRHAITACLLSSSFNNPLGCTMPDAKKRAVLDLLAHYGVPLIEDDIYGDISFGTERPKPFMALEPCGDILYCSSFSKTVAPGYRIGWMVPGRHMQRVLERKFAFTLCGPALPQRALADFLA